MNRTSHPPSRSFAARIMLFSRFFFPTSLRLCVAVVLVLASLTASAQTPAPPAGGLPSASRLQQVHDLGQRLGENSFDAETVGPASPVKENLEHHLDNYLKNEGAGLSETEREVLKEAYWEGAGKADRAHEKDYSMKTVDPPTTDLRPPTTTSPTTTTTISGKTLTPGPGTLRLTDRDGNSYFVDVDANGNYSTTVPKENFQPVKATLWTKTGKLERIVESDGTWMQVSAVTGTGTQGAMAPGGAMITGTAAYALADECRRYAMLSSLDWDRQVTAEQAVRPTGPPFLHPIRFASAHADSGNQRRPARLVSDPLPPDAVREAQKQGIEHADREFEQAKLKQSLKDRGVNPDNEARFKQEKTKLDDKQQTAQQNKGPKLTPEEQQLLDDMNRLTNVTNMINAHNNAVKLLGPNPETEKAAQARRLQRQAQQMREDGLGPQAEAIEKSAQQLYGGPLPPLQADTAGGAPGTSGQVEGQTVDPTRKPVGWAMAAGAIIFPPERPSSLNDPTLDKQLREAPVDGCTPKGETNGSGEFKLKLDYRLDYNWGSKLKLGPTYDYKTTPPAGTDTPKSQPEPPTPKTPPGQSSGATQGAFYRTGVGSRENCAYAYTDSLMSQVGAAYAKEPWTIKVGKITLNPELGYNFQVTKGTQLGLVHDALNAVNIPLADFTFDQHETGGIGHVQAAWRVGQDFQWKIPDNITGAEEEVCGQIAPVPSWDPAHWPEKPAEGIPTFHITLSQLHD